MSGQLWQVTVRVALALSIAANIYLLRVVLHRGEVEPGAGRYSLQAGDKVPPIEGKDVDGELVKVRYGMDGRSTVIYVVTPTCVWCERNAPNFTTIVRQAHQSYHFVVVALHRERLEDLASSIPDGVQLIADLSEQSKKRYFLGGTPQTVVVSSGGVVLRNWLGAYSGDLENEVAKYFSVDLPGLTADPAPRDRVCLDELGRAYSRGFVAAIKGAQRECGPDGEWTAPSR